MSIERINEISPNNENQAALMTLSCFYFPEGTVGSDLITRELEGRQRPESTFSRNLASLLVHGRNRPIYVFGPQLASTIEESLSIFFLRGLLKLKLESLNEKQKKFWHRKHLESHLDYFKDFLKEGPEGSLIRRTLGNPHFEPTGSISREAEKTRKLLVSALLDNLKNDQKDFLIQHFGLNDGIVRNYPEIAGITGEDKEAVHQGILSGLKALRQPPAAERLRDYSPWKAQSLGRSLLDLTCYYDFVSQLGITNAQARELQIRDLLLSPEVRKEIFSLSPLRQQRKTATGSRVSYLLSEINRNQISDQAASELTIAWRDQTYSQLIH